MLTSLFGDRRPPENEPPAVSIVGCLNGWIVRPMREGSGHADWLIAKDMEEALELAGKVLREQHEADEARAVLTDMAEKRGES